MNVTKLVLRITALGLPVLYLLFLLADRAGVWSHLRRLDMIESVAARFEKSYAADASHPVSVGDPEWDPLMRLVYRYSNTEFPRNKQPQTIARFQATVSGSQTSPDGVILSEWTAPSTPFAVLFVKWSGQSIPREDCYVAGTIGDLRSWIARSKDDFRFLVKDVFLVLFSFAVGFSLLLHEHYTAKRS